MNELFKNLKKYKSKVALIDDKLNSVDYTELFEIKNRFKKLFPTGSIVLILVDNSIDSISSYIGFLDLKVVKVIVDNNISRKFFKDLEKKYNLNYVICLQNKMKFLSIKGYKILYGNVCYKKLGKKNLKINTINSLLLTTSGSTSSPKFVRLSQLNLIDNCSKIKKYFGLTHNSRAITSLQPAYSYAISIINSHISAGGSLIITKKNIMESKFWECFKKFKINSFYSVPIMIKYLEKIDFKILNSDNLKYIAIAGGGLENYYLRKISKYAKKRKIKIFYMYGQTETSPRMSYLNPKYFELKLGSIGQPLKGGKFFLKDEDGNIIKKSKRQGELIYSGKNVCLGYANNYKDLYLGDINKGILNTGDYAIRDSKNFYYITGRKKKISKIFGQRIDLDHLKKKPILKKIIKNIYSNDKELFIDTFKKNKFIEARNHVSSILKINKLYIKRYEETYKPEFKMIK